MEDVWVDILFMCVGVFVVCLLECGLLMTESMFPSAALCMVKLVGSARLSVVSGLPTMLGFTTMSGLPTMSGFPTMLVFLTMSGFPTMLGFPTLLGFPIMSDLLTLLVCQYYRVPRGFLGWY